VATNHRSYHSFTKADELSTEQIDKEWGRHRRLSKAALSGSPCEPLEVDVKAAVNACGLAPRVASR
jgi:hypothetical protein